MNTRLITALAALGFAILGASASAQAPEYYRGKVLTVIVGLEVGGTSDTFARTFAIYLKEHIPGKPTVIVQNMPGGAGLLATNFLFEKAKPDGLTILWGPWDPLAQALGGQGMRARYERFEFVGGTGDIRVNYARTDSVPDGIKQPSDIVKAKHLYIGDSSITGVSGLLARLSLDVMGVPHQLVTGYRGGTDVFLALQRNEVQFHNTSVTTFRSRTRDFIQSGQGLGINYFVPVDATGRYERSKFIDEMPAFPDLFTQVHGKMPAGPKWDALNWLTNQIGEMTFVGLAPPGTPPEMVAALRQGYEAASNDPEVVKQSMAVNGIPYSFVGPERGGAIFRSLAEVSPEVLATLRQTIEAGRR
jgi:tripartite-type tricarboxylate transporter receptor subunit TctC